MRASCSSFPTFTVVHQAYGMSSADCVDDILICLVHACTPYVLCNMCSWSPYGVPIVVIQPMLSLFMSCISYRGLVTPFEGTGAGGVGGQILCRRDKVTAWTMSKPSLGSKEGDG